MKAQLSLATAALLVLLPPATCSPIDLSSWSVVQYEFNSQPNANWVLSNGNTTATQTVNADASIFLSDFTLSDSIINGSWFVPNAQGDDDFIGFVFGYNDRGMYYLFDWKMGDQNDPLGFAQRGMSIKVVNKNSDPTGADLWPTIGSANVTTLLHNTIPWAANTVYDFHLEFHPGQFTIEVRQGATLLQSWTVNDSTFTTGNFGFYNYSQGNVVYQGFTLDPAPPLDPIVVPEPGTGTLLVLIGVGLLGFLAMEGKRWRLRTMSS